MVEVQSFVAFKYHKFVLTKLGIYPTESQNGINTFFKSFSSYYILIVLAAYDIADAVFVFENLTDFSNALRGCIFIVSAFQANSMFFCYGRNVHKIYDVHMKLQEIIDGIGKNELYHIFSTLFLRQLIVFFFSIECERS